MQFYSLEMYICRLVFSGYTIPKREILFVCFFPQIVQGPIPRYQELSATLYEGHPFNEREFCRAFHALWHVHCLEPLDFL